MSEPKPSDEHLEYYSYGIPEGYILCVREVGYNRYAVWAQRESFPSPPGTKRGKRIIPKPMSQPVKK